MNLKRTGDDFLAYRIVLASVPQKFLDKSDEELFGRIIRKLESLKQNPFPSDVKMVVGRKEKIFRVRAGKYRILYAVFEDKKEILVTDIDRRERVYG